MFIRSLWDGDAEEEPHEQIGQVVIRLELETLVLIRQLEGHDGGWSVQVNPNKPSKILFLPRLIPSLRGCGSFPDSPIETVLQVSTFK